MGRWAQRQRRGGGGPRPAAPTPPPTLFTATDDGGGLLTLVFNGDVTADAGGTPDSGSLFLDGNPTVVFNAENLFSNIIQLTQAVDPSVGAVLTWASQPPYITTPINLAGGATVD